MKVQVRIGEELQGPRHPDFVLVLGLYQDQAAAAAVLREIRRRTAWRAAVIHKTPEGRVAVQNRTLPILQGIFWGGGIGLLAGSVLASGWTVFACAAAGVFLGALVARRFVRGVDENLVRRLKRLLVRGETAVIVLVPARDARRVPALLRRTEEATAVFAFKRGPFPEEFEAVQAKEREAPEPIACRAARLAAELEIGRPDRMIPLHRRLRRMRKILTGLRRNLNESVLLEQGLVAGAEWFLDNAYLIQGQIAEVAQNLAGDYERRLPLLTAGIYAGFPRIYALAAELVAHTEARLDRAKIVDFLRSFQSVSPLSLAELWAFPLILRYVLLEWLAQLGLKIARRQEEGEEADFWANRLLAAARRDPDRLPAILAELVTAIPEPSPFFAIKLAGHLHDETETSLLLQGWFERKLDLGLPEALAQEQSRQAADGVAIGNAVNSLRYLNRLPWPEVFPEVSLVEAVLNEDPAGIYHRMDPETRAGYREAVEEIARWSGRDELAAARAAVALSREEGGDRRRNHVGYYLVDAGRPLLERNLACRPPLSQRLKRRIRRRPALFYLGGFAALTAFFPAILFFAAARPGADRGGILALAALAFLPASEMALQTMNRLVMRIFSPAALPRMSFKDGIPAEYRTMVVVPMLLASPETIRREAERLEIRYLANPDPALHFGLLADFLDAAGPEAPKDGELLREARERICELNLRHGENRFYLFHRGRRFSRSEGLFIGWERKRGKLEEFNRLINGEESGIIVEVGDPGLLCGIRYVLTLDADTQLPPETARRLVETMAHPLNEPRVAEEKGTVAEGYAIIQPRVCPSLPSVTASYFSRLFSDSAGLDPYCHAVSDVYQDLAGEGTFYGKGIYDPRVFHRLLTRRFPEERILSHDLLEGAYLRVGFASDVVLLDEFPRTYGAYASREHRWIRGDWQLIDWLFPRVPLPDGRSEPNPLSVLNRWKILDNLRRSLVAPATLILLLSAWFGTPDPLLWSGFTAVAAFWPGLPGSLLRLLAGPRTASARREVLSRLAKDAVSLVLLPHRAFLAIDAVIRVWYRRLVSHRHLLAWETAQAAHGRYGSRDGARRTLLAMGGIALAALALIGAVKIAAPKAFAPALPFLVLWTFSPLAVWLLNLSPSARRPAPLSARDRGFLREIARATWRYFDDLLGPADHWLPPDNYQEAPRCELAHRTSPTNVGMWLLSALAAYDLGYLPAEALLERALATAETLRRMEKHEGHLLNWYNTETLEPLRPRYVSTVDSGNLLASIWIFIQGCRGLSGDRPLEPRIFAGLADTLANLRRSLPSRLPVESRNALERITRLLAGIPDRPAAMATLLRRVAAAARELRNAVRESGCSEEAAYWSEKLAREAAAWVRTGKSFLPWFFSLDEARRSGLSNDLPAASPGGIPTYAALASGEDPAWMEEVRRLRAEAEPGSQAAFLLDRLLSGREKARRAAQRLLARRERLLSLLGELAAGMDLGFLYDPERRLFAVGYDVGERRLDTSYYDLLASEARLASFVAIARRDVPLEHWATLGRPFGAAGGEPVLLSWNGTIFEYLMPALFNEAFAGSLLEDACRRAVELQMDYARRRGIPWGISEAAFSALDAHRIYQYRAFGVPSLGLKRGLEEDVVVAPYATALALGVAPAAAVQNLRRLAGMGLRGMYGFYESLDFTRERCPAGERGVIIYAHMAHHQGMTLVSLANALCDGIMRKRFHADPRVRAAESLLFERTPAAPPPTLPPSGEGPPPRLLPIISPPATGRLTTANTKTPRAHLLANGELSVMVTNAGGGYIRWRDFDLTRWRADTTCDAWGIFVYLRDVKEGAAWSAAYHPLGHGGRHYGVKFAADRVEFRRRDAGIETIMEIAVSPEDAAEIRRLTLVNLSGRMRQLEVTSYLELALAPHGADRAHPAFAKLFVETEALPEMNALLAWRRPRRPEEPSIYAAHLLVAEKPCGEGQYETDRARFLGRGRSPRDPAALTAPLSGTTGTVLDPVFSLRGRLTIGPGERVKLAFVTIAAETREQALGLLGKYRAAAAVENALELAWTHAQLELRHFGIQAEEAQRFQELAGHVLYPNPRLRPPGERLRQNLLGRARLWAHGISGDLPIIVVMVEDESEIGVVREVLLAHTYLRRKGLQADLVILNGEAASYGQPLQELLKRLVQAQAIYTGLDRPGGIFLRAANQMPREDLTLLLATARVVLVAARGPLAQQLAAPVEALQLPPRLKPGRRGGEEQAAPLPFLVLPCFNGLGGFTPDGREYAVYLGPGTHTPAPWTNVMANREFGTLISESGSGFTWYGNSQGNRLTSWANDPVADPVSEAIYLRDEETGIFWTPTPLPIRGNDPYRARHGQGYTVFEHNGRAIEAELLVFVPVEEGADPPLRLARLRLRNASPRRRRLSVFAYNDWILGTDREETAAHIVTKWDVQSRAVFARNAYRPEFGNRVAFAALGPAASWFTADRTEFIGRNGSLAHPAALERKNLSGRAGAGLDPCAAQQIVLELEPGRSAEIVFLLGEAADVEEARRLIRSYRDPLRVEEALARTRAFWDRLLGAVQVRTPLPSMDFLMNRWLLYQTTSCRLWSRSALYQSGGAYGFRDQLQDVLALLHARPELAREHILRAAARQFSEGDVQHWWHPHSGAGTRTRCSDDLLWLVYATIQYVLVTGDRSILEARAPFLEGRPLAGGEQEIYLVPSAAMEDGTLYEHCRRALERALTAGPHGLPLIGSGDWNDGFDRVGREGRGESVWLAFFLAEVLRGFAELARAAGRNEQAERYRALALSLARSVEEEAWDGAWYRRAYFDDGTPLGAAEGSAARIDSIAQSWAVISGGARPERASRALLSAEEHLWWKEENLVPLFWPPFPAEGADPGYIRAYPPGVRENGGQYNHAAVWLAMAFARHGDGGRAVALLQAVNPVERARTPEEAERYKVEPYVLAADVYTHPDRRGRGGWSWYTGSAGWMYRVFLEEILGFKRRGNTLRLSPVIPADWPGYAITYRFGESIYEIEVENQEGAGRGKAAVELDGTPLPDETVPLVDDGGRHRVRAVLRPAEAVISAKEKEEKA